MNATHIVHITDTLTGEERLVLFIEATNELLQIIETICEEGAKRFGHSTSAELEYMLKTQDVSAYTHQEVLKEINERRERMLKITAWVVNNQ